MEMITIVRAYNPDLSKALKVELQEVSGYLYEYNGLQFCICLCDGFWYAIELRTGHSAAVYEREINDSDEYCIEEIKRMMALKSTFEYTKALVACETFMQRMGFDVPINKKVTTDESN